jgi:hypothetical protein
LFLQTNFALRFPYFGFIIGFLFGIKKHHKEQANTEHGPVNSNQSDGKPATAGLLLNLPNGTAQVAALGYTFFMIKRKNSGS